MTDNISNYVMVPREPTEEMLKAASDALDPVIHGSFSYHRTRLEAALKAALAAAPSPSAAEAGRWIPVGERLPTLRRSYRDPAPYVLATDEMGRMSVAYCDWRSSGQHIWISAKAIGDVTHWQPLPEPPR